MNHSMPAGSMTATDVGMAPMTGTPPADYVMRAADSDMYEIQSSKLALARSKRADVKDYARMMIRDHTTTTNSLKAGVKRSKSPKPPMKLSAENAALVAQLRGTGPADFDRVYLEQQTMSHQKAWALHKGFATDGTDPALMQVAASAVPIVEGHLAQVKQMSSGAMSSGM
jgi:putative membrane protein